MYKPMSAAVLKEMEEAGRITLTIKPGWEQSGSWTSIPAYINYQLASEQERVFTCYYSKEGNSVRLTNIEASDLIKDNKGLVDGYLFVALKGLMDWTLGTGMKRLIVDSHIPAIVDHMLELGFNLNSKGIQPGGYGCKILEVENGKESSEG